LTRKLLWVIGIFVRFVKNSWLWFDGVVEIRKDSRWKFGFSILFIYFFQFNLFKSTCKYIILKGLYRDKT
jgi:hypothetical protein